MKYNPHDYQRYAINFIKEHPIATILLDMGMGKTSIVLAAINALMFDSFEVSKVLIIAPLRVAKHTWSAEIQKWDQLKGLRYSIAVGTAAERMKALQEDADIYIINRENVPWLIEKSGLPFDYDMVVIDELSAFKNWQAKRFKALMKVRPKVKRIVGLTGTPSSNGLMDLFAEYKVLDMGERLGRFISQYRVEYFVPDQVNGPIVYSYRLRPGADKRIYDRISDITISMKGTDHLKILFCDTGLEFPEMYRHIAKVERDVGMPVTVVKADVAFEYLMLEGVKKRKADSKIVQKYGTDIRGYGWPGPKLRWCTKMLKDIPREKYLSRLRDEYEVIEYVGLAADEGYRMQRRQNRRECCRHPLVDWGMTEEDCLKYCYERGYDWGGLYRYFRRVSCWCCPLQSLDELRQLYKHFPALWRQLGEWDGRTWRKFRKDYSVRELEIRFDFEDECREKGMPVSGRAFFFDFRKRLAEIGLAGTDRTSVGVREDRLFADVREDGLSADSKGNAMLVGGKEDGISAGGEEDEVFTDGREEMGRIPMEYVKKKLSELKPYENNPRINDEAVDDVVESIRQCSYIAPIVIDEDGVILAGHTRYKALKKLGYQECEVVVVSALTDEQKKKYRLYDNKTAEMASWNQKKLSAELCDVDFCGYDFGQPETALPDDGAEKDSPRTMTCPCCGEVFEV